MPNKHNTKCSHHIPKMRFSVRNWREYDAALRARGSLTMWVTPEAMAVWTAQPHSTPWRAEFLLGFGNRDQPDAALWCFAKHCAKPKV